VKKAKAAVFYFQEAHQVIGFDYFNISSYQPPSCNLLIAVKLQGGGFFVLVFGLLKECPAKPSRCSPVDIPHPEGVMS
jgi:hypothetical protein